MSANRRYQISITSWCHVIASDRMSFNSCHLLAGLGPNATNTIAHVPTKRTARDVKEGSEIMDGRGWTYNSEVYTIHSKCKSAIETGGRPVKGKTVMDSNSSSSSGRGGSTSNTNNNNNRRRYSYSTRRG